RHVAPLSGCAVWCDLRSLNSRPIRSMVLTTHSYQPILLSNRFVSRASGLIPYDKKSTFKQQERRSMTSLNWVKKTGVRVSGLLLLASAAWPQSCPPAAEKIAKAYGFDSWGQIEAVRYTFNIDIPALKLKGSHTWMWEPKADRVTYEGKDKAGNPVKATYVR